MKDDHRLGTNNISPWSAVVVALCFIFFGVLVGALGLITMGGSRDVAIGVTVTFAITAFFFLTATHWVKVFVSVCCFLAARAVVGSFIRGSSQLFCIELVAVFSAATYLTFRFFKAKPNKFDAICLAGTLLTMAKSIVDANPLRMLLLAVAFLAVSFIFDRLCTARVGARRNEDTSC